MKKEKKVKFHSIYTPKNANQEKYVEYLNNPDTNIIISIGPAGTGKTMFGCIKAIHELPYGNIDKIVVTRPLVTVEEELGFLPGDILKKMDPWTRPIFDIFLEHISKTELNSMLYNNIIEISPLAFMRGRTFKNSFIIADEMQNSSPNQMKMLTSRLGENSRMVITGDLKQTDRQIHDNGLQDFITKYKAYQTQMTNKDTIKLVEFETGDIERSRAVQEIINMYNYREKPTLLHKEPSNICNLEYNPKKPQKIWETD
jgi:phosphate starvation-inducible PhoH-like protein